MSVRLQTSLGTALVQDIPLGNIPESECPGLPRSGKGNTRVARSARTRTHVYTQTHTYVRARILHIHTACFLRSPSPRGAGLFLFKEQTVSAQTRAL